MEYITKPTLDTMDTAGVVGQPQYETGAEDYIPTSSADLTGGDSIPKDYMTGDQGAKWENPNPQDVHPSGQHQYER